jgi:hypothetical protein
MKDIRFQKAGKQPTVAIPVDEAIGGLQPTQNEGPSAIGAASDRVLKAADSGTRAPGAAAAQEGARPGHVNNQITPPPGDDRFRRAGASGAWRMPWPPRIMGH